MNKAWLCIATISLLACGPSQYSERYVERSDDAIVGGTTFVGLPAVGTLIYSGNQHCTATLIGSRTLLTAAHCVDGVNPAAMKFGIGPSLSNLEAIIDVASVSPHPDYHAQTISNDIATIELSSDAPVAPMPVANSLTEENVGDDFLFVGYGLSNGFQGVGAGTKRAVWIEVKQLGETQFGYSDVGLSLIHI